MRIYIAGPYRADTRKQRDANIQQARDTCAELFRKGHTPFCPHSMTAHFDDDYPDISERAYLYTDIVWLKLCDAVVFLGGWEDSSGSCTERRIAEDEGITIYEAVEAVPEATKEPSAG